MLNYEELFDFCEKYMTDVQVQAALNNVNHILSMRLDDADKYISQSKNVPFRDSKPRERSLIADRMLDQRAFREFCDEYMTDANIITLHSNLNKIVKMRETKANAQEAKESAMREKIRRKQAQFLEIQDKACDELESEGLDSQLDIKLVVTAKKKSKLKPPKYEYRDYNGIRRTWTGQGRKPKVIEQALNRAKSEASKKKILDSFLIK